LPFLERLTLPATVRLIEIIDSTGLVAWIGRLSGAATLI
jgi:hypothetical protein